MHKHTDAHIASFEKSNYAVCGLYPDFMLNILIHITVFIYDDEKKNKKQKNQTKNMLQSIFTWIKELIERKEPDFSLVYYISMWKKWKTLSRSCGVLTKHEFSERHKILRIAVNIEIDTCMFVENTHKCTSYHMLERSFEKCCCNLCLSVRKCERSSLSHNVLMIRLHFFRVDYTSAYFFSLFVWRAPSRTICCIRPIDSWPDAIDSVQMKHAEPAFSQYKYFRFIFCGLISNDLAKFFVLVLVKHFIHELYPN